MTVTVNVLSDRMDPGDLNAALDRWIEHRRMGMNLVAMTHPTRRRILLIGHAAECIEDTLGHEHTHLALYDLEGMETSLAYDRITCARGVLSP